MVILKKNLRTLKKYHPEIYQTITNFESDQSCIEVEKSKSGYPTLSALKSNRKLYLHSKYNPEREAEQFVSENFCSEKGFYTVYGFGFGYHLKKLIEKNYNLKLWVFETNKDIFYTCLRNVELEYILANPNVKLTLTDDEADFAKHFKEALDSGYNNLLIHLPSLNVIPDHLSEIKYMLEDFRVKEHTINTDYGLEANFMENIKSYDSNVDILFESFKDIPAVIVSGGPSLDKNKHLLKQVKNRAVIISVGTAVKPLLDSGVYPDIIIITDPQNIVYNQLDGLDIEIPIIALSSCNRRVLENYKGFKYIALQEGFPLAEKLAKENNHRLVRTGGSVSTTALDVAIKFGCDPIIFTGLDLAYTGGTSHVKGTHFYQEIKEKNNLRPVSDINGGTVYTGKNLYIYLKWIQNRIKEEPDLTFIDATEGGAKIEGTKIMFLKEVIRKFLSKKEISIEWKIRK